MWKEVFKVGLHTDANGNEREWTEEDLNSIVEKYNNQLPDERHDAPVVIGHLSVQNHSRHRAIHGQDALGEIDKRER